MIISFFLSIEMCEENNIAELLETMTDEPEKVINEFIEIMKGNYERF